MPSPTDAAFRLPEKRLVSAFSRFVSMRGPERLLALIDTIEERESILPILSQGAPLSSLLAPLHCSPEILQSLHPELALFFRLSQIIEYLLFSIETTKREPSSQELRKLLPLIARYLTILPSESEMIEKRY